MIFRSVNMLILGILLLAAIWVFIDCKKRGESVLNSIFWSIMAFFVLPPMFCLYHNGFSLDSRIPYGNSKCVRCFILCSGEHTMRKNIATWMTVDIVEKHNQKSGITTTGKVKEILKPGQIHPRGIKVRLTAGEMGRVERIV